MTEKAADAFRTISEAALELDLPQHVLRHWEDTFGAIRPMRRAGGRRYYRLQDLELISGVRALLHDEQYTTKGVQKIFKDHGAAFVADIGRQVMAGLSPEDAIAVAHQANQPDKGIDRAPLERALAHLQDLKAQLSQLRNSVPSE